MTMSLCRGVMIAVLGLVLSAGAWGAIETYQFADEVERKRYRSFVAELRCPKCQNQNLADSDAPIAKDLRRELHRLIRDGKSDIEIVDYMVSRHGEFILYTPPFKAATAVLWLAPAVLLLLGIGVVWHLVRRRGSAPPPLSAQEQQRLRALLGEKDD